ncbi:MAG: hypothetical protein L3J35_02360 [Bacteroidales bacterium]|nr:hypothetical protein [Bacteroidales bacterium]
MQKFSARKILSAILLILILVFAYLLFKKINPEDSNFQDIIFLGGIFFSGLLLFMLVLTKATRINKGINDNSEKKETNISKNIEQKEQLQREQMENHTLAIISDIQKQNNINELAESLLIKFAKQFSVVQGVVYVRQKDDKTFKTVATYALYGETDNFVEGIGINGQVAINKKLKLIKEIPENYITVISGLGSSSPSNLLILPFVNKNKTVALIELAAFDEFPEIINEIYNEINDSIAEKFDSLN